MDKRKVLYIGNDITYQLFHDVSERSNTEIVPFYGETATSEEIINAAVSDTYAMIILNIEEIMMAISEANSIIIAIQKTSRAKLVIMALGYSPKANIIVNAARNGVSYFMLENSLGSLNTIYIQTLAGVKNVGDIYDDIQNDSGDGGSYPSAYSNARQMFKSVSISLASAIPRMGVTTVAIQMIKYLMSKHKSCCFIDMTDTKYVRLCSTYYDSDREDIEHHCYTFDGIDMYYDVTAELLDYIKIKNYDFMVFDFGCITNDQQRQNGFLQQKHRIIVSGNKPNEYEAFTELLQSIYKTKIHYIYNFISQAGRLDVLDESKEYKRTAYFFPFLDDCYSLSSDSIPMFDEIFAEYFPKEEPAEEPKKKKRGLFGRKKR